jgi:outer membrane murein-binding lipoprotein Lpp
MNRLFLICSLAVAAGTTSLLLPRQAVAAVSDEDFNALKNMVQELNQKFDKLEQVHEQDQQTHQQDQKEIQQLRQQLDQTQQLATNAVQKAEAAARVQPIAPTLQGPSATHQFQLAGDAETVFGAVHGQSGAFAFADFAPIFLYRANDNVLFEAGFDFFLANSAPAAPGTAYGWDLSFATLDYLLNDYVTVEAGNMLLPLGTYSERSAGWLNKFPDNPLPRGLLPGSGIGVQLRGAVPIGDNGQLLTYSAYGVNGPSSFDGSGTAASLDLNGNVGVLSAATSIPRRYGYGLPGTSQAGTTFSTVGNLNPDPSGGGRIGWFYPWKPHYDVELGVSGQSGPWDPQGGQWSAVVLDAAMHVSPNLEVKGEYINTWVDTTDLGSIRPNGWWVQAGYKLAGLNLDWPVINNVELVGRYDQSKDGLVPVTNAERYTAGFVYYFSSTLLFEGDYEWLHSAGPSSGYFPANELLFQISYGF